MNDVQSKIAILSGAAKFDASCSSSGSARPNSGGLGNGAVAGICHAWSADGRCVSLLKVLLSNACAWNCAYCVNRSSNDTPRASLEPEELIRTIVDFYRRNYIEGAFLSSGVIGCPDATMERLIDVARTLRTREKFFGYLHMKIIPGTSENLVLEAARWADRVSVNIEMPSARSLSLLAPDKTPASIFQPMKSLARASGFVPKQLPSPVKSIDAASKPQASFQENLPELRETVVAEPRPLYDTNTPSVLDARKTRSRNPDAPSIPAGQTTQMVIGASPDTDAAILHLAENLYLAYDVRRVYYSAYIPVSTDPRLPMAGRPPLLREHRLYQADWLFRFYGFTASEILDPAQPFLAEDIDPKCAWALRNMDAFPVEINKADYRTLLKVPGIGPVSASRIVKARRLACLGFGHLKKLGVVLKRAQGFITCGGLLATGGPWRMGKGDSPETIRRYLKDKAPAWCAPLQFTLDFDGAADA